MGNVDTGSSKSVSASPAVRKATDTLAGQINGMAGGTMYVAPSSTTQQGWQQALGAAGNADYTSGLQGLIKNYSGIANGTSGLDDPGYTAMRSKLANDVGASVNSTFNNSGLFGSDSNQKSLASGLADSLGALDYQQYRYGNDQKAQAASMLPSLFSAAQLPSAVTQSVGSAQDASAQAKQTGELDWLTRLTSALGGTAEAGGTNKTVSSPLWLQLMNQL